MRPTVDRNQSTLAAGGAAPRMQVNAPSIALATLALLGPMIAGAWAGRLDAGMVAAIGGLAMSDGASGDTLRERLHDIALGFAAVLAAMLAGAVAANAGAPGAAALVALAAIAAVLGGASRPMARATTRFVLFMVIASHVAAPSARPLELLPLLMSGAAWSALLSLAMVGRDIPQRGEAASRAAPTARQRWRRWARSLMGWNGWVHTLQLTACLGIAEAIRVAWPLHHSYWIAVTVAIVVRRQPSRMRTLERAAGTALGVVAGSVLLSAALPLVPWLCIIALLAALRPVLKERNYLAYSAVMTPLIVAMMEFGQPSTPMLMADRLGATVLGCALALGAGYVFSARGGADRP